MATSTATPPAAEVASIGTDDLKDAIREGWADFMARPTSAIFLIVIYPFLGLLLYRFTFDQALLPLLFPIASGFALVGPLTAVGLYEISRRRARNEAVDGVSAYQSVGGEIIVPIVQIGLLLLVIYAAWLGMAQLIYLATMGSFEPAGLGDLLATVVSSGAGWALIALGCGVGFLFALVVLAIGAISLPAVYDRHISAADAVGLSVRAFAVNPRAMSIWGLIIAAGLALGSLPAFLGLMIVLPVFGHATWHLYKRLVPPPA